MPFKSAENAPSAPNDEADLVFYDVEVFPNLFLVNWINVRIRNVIGLSKKTVVALGLLFAADDFLREIVELLVGITHQTGGDPGRRGRHDGQLHHQHPDCPHHLR